MASITQQNLFIGGEGGYHTYRIPSIITASSGAILAFCEGRKESMSDSGDIDILLRKSMDNGISFTDTRIVISDPGYTCGNPSPVQDIDTGIIWLLFNKNLSDGPEDIILQGKAPRTVWITFSRDDGETWADPKDITSDVKRPDWTWYATGPCHGIQLKSGRLLIPCDHNTLGDYKAYSHCIYSDDHGRTWQIGGSTDTGANECTALETTDGWLYLNCRNYSDYHGPLYRAIAWSRDGGESFSPLVRDVALPEPVCQASVCRYSNSETGDCDRVLFSNPGYNEDEHDRMKMTVRLSCDECRTWPVAKVLYNGPSAYSDLCVTSDGIIHCFYESGNEHAYEKLVFASFDLDWLMK